ncbi:MAG: hypothetical protein JWO70_3458 [Betaproteobacteria bacterium]|nr:hypothetical protein [Betaproteobacteria bacterium]
MRRVLERLHSLRLQMMLIVALTAATGFLASVTLLHGGLHTMWIRYPLAVGAAYAAFLFFLWCWLRLRWDDFVGVPDFDGGSGSQGAAAVDAPLPWSGAGGQFGGGGASGSFDDGSLVSDPPDGSAASDAASDAADAAGSALDLEELTVVVLAIVALASAIFAALWIIWIAPALFAELTLDAALGTGLYRRLRHITGEYWLRTALRKTVWPILAVAVLFGVAGAAMQVYAPEAKSVGHVIRHMKAP